MDNQWRIPTVMELSRILAAVKISTTGHLWTCTEYETTRLWGGNWAERKRIPNYNVYFYDESLECVYVKTNGEYLSCSERYPHSNYSTALERGKNLTVFEAVKYNITRAKVCNERSLETSHGDGAIDIAGVS